MITEVAVSGAGGPGDAVDLTSCDREPIHVPNAIQPHGLLFAIDGAQLCITGVSANVSAHLGAHPGPMLGMSLAHFTDAASFEHIAEAAARQSAGVTKRIGDVRFNGVTGQPWQAFLHTGPSGMLLECEVPRADQPPAGDATILFERFETAARRLQDADSVQAICGLLAREIRRLTGFHRVKIYRFAQNWNGAVVAEDGSGHLPSYLGLHFPASDIPVQARALYTRNHERLIPDIGYIPVPFLQAGAEPIDLSQAMLRSVSPIHCEYLKNMQVGASMSVSILCRGRLWGLAACHHREIRYVAPELRQASVVLAHLAAGRITLVEDLQITRHTVAAQAAGALVLTETPDGGDHRDSLMRHGGELLRLMGASGLVLAHGERMTAVGQTPGEADLACLLAWLAGNDAQLFETDHLAAHYPGAAEMPEAAGIMAVKLGGAPQNLMVWFRPEIAHTISWAGNPAKPVLSDAIGQRLTPRHSFDAWQEQVRNQSYPWQTHEAMAAKVVRDTFVNLMLRHSLDLARINEELEAFAHVASHDLREPLRQIATFGSLLERAFRDRKLDEAHTSAKVLRWFDGIQTSSQRLQRLIDDVANYARLGAQARPMAPTDLNTLFAQVRGDFSIKIESSGASLSIAKLPAVMCDGFQIRQVLQNLVSNALKYRHPDRPPVITISARERPPAAGDALADLPVLDIRFQDNGIGFDNKHCERIFEPFQRLHSNDVYEGSGIGLSICRKVLRRHDGAIRAEGRLGEGSVFILSLPLRPLSGDGPNS